MIPITLISHSFMHVFETQIMSGTLAPTTMFQACNCLHPILPFSLGFNVDRSESRQSRRPLARKPKMGPKWHLPKCLSLSSSIFRQGSRPRPPPLLTGSRGRALNTRHRNRWHSGGGATGRNCCGSDNHRVTRAAYSLGKT